MLPSMGTWWAALSHLFMGSSSCCYRCVRTCSWPPASPVCAQSSRPAPSASARALSQCLWGPRGSCGWCFQLRNTQPAPLPPDATLRWGISLRLAPSLGPPLRPGAHVSFVLRLTWEVYVSPPMPGGHMSWEWECQDTGSCSGNPRLSLTFPLSGLSLL